MNIPNFITNKKIKNQDELIQIKINRKINNPKRYNFNISPKKNRYGNFNGNKNLNIINLNNIKIKNLGNLKYNKSVLDLHKLNKNLDNIPSINRYINKNKIESDDPNNKKIKIKKMNSINLPSVSDDRTSNTDNTNNKNYVAQTKSTNSNLIKLKENSNNEKVEKEKIQEFKNLLQQIVSDFES